MARTDVITFKGKHMTLLGAELKVGQAAPSFTCVNRQLAPVQLEDFTGRVVVISVVPSLDTPVCELQTVRFNEEAAKLNAKVLTISVDLPFAASRFCEAHNIGDAEVLSDYQERDFGQAYGVLIDELKLLTRAVFVIDEDGTLAYQEIVPEVTEHPDYEAVLQAVKALV